MLPCCGPGDPARDEALLADSVVDQAAHDRGWLFLDAATMKTPGGTWPPGEGNCALIPLL
jgi:hypothetical protein